MNRILTIKALARSGRTGKIRWNEIYCSASKGTYVCWEIQNVGEVTISEKVKGEKNMRALIVGNVKYQTRKTRGFFFVQKAEQAKAQDFTLMKDFNNPGIHW